MNRTGPLAWAVALLATATMAVSYVDRLAISVLAPTIMKALHLSDGDYGWIVAAFSIAYLVGAPLAGRFIDRVGARRGLVASVILWSVVAAAHALVPGMFVLFMLRILLGIAEAPSFPGAAQTITRVLPPSERSLGFGILFCGSSFGAMIAPPLVTWLEVRYGWRLALVGTSVVGLTWVPIWITLTGRGWAKKALDANPTADVPPETAPGQPLRAPILKAAIDAGVPFSWTRLLRRPSVLRAAIMIVAAAPLTSFVLAWGAKLLVDTYRIPQSQVGRYLWLPPAVFDLGSIGFGYLATLRDRRARTSHPFLLLAALGFALVLASQPLARTAWGATTVLAICMVGTGGMYALVTSDVMHRLPKPWIARSAGITAAAQSLAIILTNPVVGSLKQHTGTYTIVTVGLALWTLPGVAFWLALEGRVRREVAPDP